ncbi:hypothetical protein UNDKW_3913 [Undibacterium sp. KW1]|uniref:DUF1801 domain-containing protein n=1 Tax=Undibacterium sp. KW1 TaxID=2058624 RepID=UPI001331E210|nr:DUF1801 domain-containing protein [Undibacterium sp. KW1]BBB62186.1 hypothetical protein UNDKW_3913 [Undibacterium sp. KW1]
MSTERINKLLQDIRMLNEDNYALVQSLREMILKLDEGVSEEVKYGGLLFSAARPFCGVFSYKNHVTLEFGLGASLPDKYKKLEGEGKYRRHIKLTSEQDISDKHVHDYLLLALKAASE